MFMTVLVTVIAAYLIGSVNFAVIFSDAFVKKDVRNYGSGNAGATNVLRVVGVVPGLLTFVCDAIKGFAACLLGRWIFGFIAAQTSAAWAMPIYGAYLCGLACILGHIFPIFFRFKGGKGVAISVGIYAVCCYPAILIGLAVFAILMLVTRIVSVGSLTATVIVIALSMFLYDSAAAFFPQAIMSIAIGAIIFICHRENIRRLLAGEEKKLTFGRAK